jgi:hypothetical protein
MVRLILRFLRFLASIINTFFNIIFAINLLGGILRFVVIILGGLTIWIIIAVKATPPEPYFVKVVNKSISDILFFFMDADPIYRLLAGLIKGVMFGSVLVIQTLWAMIQLPILRHVIAIGVPVFLAVRISTMYLADIFELEHQRIAFRFILRAAFGFTYERIVIENGQIRPEDQNKPLAIIGGPGLVQVNLGNVAIFELINGEPHIIPPTTRRIFPFRYDAILQGFERLRDVIELRDMLVNDNKLEVDARTRDGIPVTAKNIHYLFSIWRGDQPAKQNQYAFDRQAVENIVYKRGKGIWYDNMRINIRTDLRMFIGDRNLSEFLAEIGDPETRRQKELETTLEQEASELTQDIIPIERNAQSNAQPANLTARPRFTQIFLNDAKSYRRSDGLQLHWIDVGTWVLPSSVITEKHKDAWKITYDNENQKRMLNFTRIGSRLDEMIKIIRSTPLKVFRDGRAEAKPDQTIMITIMRSYLGILRAARESYVAENQPNPFGLEESIKFLDRNIKVYLERYEIDLI